MPILGGVPVRVASLVADVLGYCDVTGATMISSELQRLMEGRQSTARDILIEELRQGNASISDVRQVSDVVAELHRFSRAAQEGAARLNLRLMAKIIAGHAAREQIYASEFLRYADMIASLSREEVIVASCIHKHYFSQEIKCMDADSRDAAAQKKAVSELVPSVFRTERSFLGAACALQRTGLIISFSGFGTIVYSISPLMEKISTLASFEEALRQEPEVS